ncbi:MAG: sodium/solute symporter [Spirochaetales bacterium]|nr:sodium/solute symporter [Spirochaetales bacterium]
MKKFFYLFLISVALFSCKKEANNLIKDSVSTSILTEMPTELGVAGPFAGIINDNGQDFLIVAGGANFPDPTWESSKQWHDEIFIYNMSSKEWIATEKKLEFPLGYGFAVSTPLGIFCGGGEFAESGKLKFTEKTFFITYSNGEIEIVPGPDLPQQISQPYATIQGDIVYLAGGYNEQKFLNTFYKINYKAAMDNRSTNWEQLSSWSDEGKANPVIVAQSNGSENSIFLFGGRSQHDGKWNFSTTVHEYSITSGKWKQLKDSPAAIMAGHGNAVGQCHIIISGGDSGYNQDGELLFGRADELKDNHPGFIKRYFTFNTITKEWYELESEFMPTAHSFAIPYKQGKIETLIIPSGEVRPRVRTKEIREIRFNPPKGNFGAGVISVIVIYLLLILGVGVFFSFRSKSSEDYFKGGQKIPYIVAAFSIFATMLSSITFVSTPAKAFATNWSYFVMILLLVTVIPIVSKFYLPFFKKLKANSAYEYLELRFDLTNRLVASSAFIIFQICRMAIVMYLPALALSAITPLSSVSAILIIGILSILYCTFGGLEAVVWTDTIQSIVLLGGAVFTLILIFVNFDGSVSEFIGIANESRKFALVEQVDLGDYLKKASLLVILLTGFGNNFVSYSSDMSIIQRYMSVKDEKAAKKSMWANVFLSIFASALFFGLGTALFVFYSKNPQGLSPQMRIDEIFPTFIANEMPPLLAGIVIAAVLAAAQSTISTSMNSASAAITTDFVQRLSRKELKDKKVLNIGRALTFVLGVLGTIFAVLLAKANIKSAWDIFLLSLGLITGGVCGLFILGIFTKRANGLGSILGIITGTLSVFLIQQFTALNALVFGFLCFSTTALFGYIFSIIINKILPSLRPGERIKEFTFFK